MNKRQLGSSALEVSEVCLGTMTFGQQNSESEAHAQLDRASAAGVNFIDTAEMYPVPRGQEPAAEPSRSSATGWPGSRGSR
jgi:aryl-alcohol dehydrogenase-like predicted oxidoreductase